MKELSIEEKAKRYDEAIKLAKDSFNYPSYPGFIRADVVFPELKKSEDERIRKALIRYFTLSDDNADYQCCGVHCKDILAYLEKQGEIDKISYEIAEKEKREFVGDGFIKCYADFQDFKERETYWLEYVGNDNYNVRSDNLLGKTYHITPCQLYTIFKKQTWLEKQGEQKPAWSEEDEEILNTIINHFKIDIECTDEDDIVRWLKSLKERYTWKPSGELMETLKYACGGNYVDLEVLESLYNDLKKLKG